MPVNLQLPEVGKGLDMDTLFRLASMFDAAHERSLKYGTPDTPGKLVKGTPATQGSPASYTTPIGPEPAPTLLSPGQWSRPLGPEYTPTTYSRNGGQASVIDPALLTQPSSRSLPSAQYSDPVLSPPTTRPTPQWQDFRPGTEGTPNRMVGGKQGTLGSIEDSAREPVRMALLQADGITEEKRGMLLDELATNKNRTEVYKKIGNALQKKDDFTLDVRDTMMLNDHLPKGAPKYVAGDTISANDWSKKIQLIAQRSPGKLAEYYQLQLDKLEAEVGKGVESVRLKKKMGALLDIVTAVAQSDPSLQGKFSGFLPDPLLKDMPKEVQAMENDTEITLRDGRTFRKRNNIPTQVR